MRQKYLCLQKSTMQKKKGNNSGGENKTQWHYPLILTLNTNLLLLLPSIVYRIKHSHDFRSHDCSWLRHDIRSVTGAEDYGSGVTDGTRRLVALHGGVDSERARWQCQDRCVSTLLPPGPWSATSGCRGRQRVVTWHKCLTDCLETHRTICLNQIFLWKNYLDLHSTLMTFFSWKCTKYTSKMNYNLWL